MTNEQLMKRFESKLINLQLAPHTTRTHLSEIRLFMAYHSTLNDFENLTTDHAKTYVNQKNHSDKISSFTLIRTCSSLTLMFDLIFGLKVTFSLMNTLQNTDDEYSATLTEDETEQLIAQTEKPFDLMLMLMLLQRGIRLAELLRINIDDVDMENSSICIQGIKGRKARFIPISVDLAKRIELQTTLPQQDIESQTNTQSTTSSINQGIFRPNKDKRLFRCVVTGDKTNVNFSNNEAKAKKHLAKDLQAAIESAAAKSELLKTKAINLQTLKFNFLRDYCRTRLA